MKVLQLLIVHLTVAVAIVKCDLLDEVNAHIYLFINGQIGDVLSKLPSPIYMRVVAVSHAAIFDALAAYRPTSTGIYAQIPKFPANQITNRNKNIAVSYALYRTHVALYPGFKPGLDDVFNRLGLNPNDQSLDLKTPVGVGNYAAQVTLNIRQNDGMNQLGNANGKKYNRFPYADYTGYGPKNTPFDLEYIGNWQPSIEQRASSFGEFYAQNHVTPQYAKTQPFSAINPDFCNSPPPFNSFASNTRGYKNQVDYVLSASYNLDDRSKMLAEYFNNRSLSLAAVAIFLTAQYNRLTIDDTIIIQTLVHIASFDAGIVAWKNKMLYDSVSPISAVRYLYGKSKISAWGGVGKGPVNDITGNEWRPYSRPLPEAEYPSSAACYCAAQFRAASLYFNSTNMFGYTVAQPKGSSLVEPGITPATDIVLGPYNTVQEYVDDCARSGVYGGVQFRAAIEEGKRLCRPVGDAAYEFLKKHL